MVWAGCPNCRGKSLGAGIPAADLDWYDRHPQVVGERIGRAIARDAKAEGMAAEWTGLGAQDGDVATSAGLEPGTPEWEEMERAAKIEFLRAMESR